MDSSRRYTGIAIINHWLTALLVIAMLTLGLAAGAAPSEDIEDYILGIHFSLGFITLLFVFWRVGYRLRQGFPPQPDNGPIESLLAKAVHRLLLLVLILQVLTGPLYLFTEGEGFSVFGLFTFYLPLESLSAIHEPMEEIHVITGVYLLPALLVIHILGGMRHFLRNESKSPAAG